MPGRSAVPEKFTRLHNTDHLGVVRAIDAARRFGYGTAGFRAVATELPFVIYRLGFLAGLRARYLNKATGIVITASHNPEEDNGVKIIDPMGEMLEIQWETHATDLVNCSDEKYLPMCDELEKNYPAKSQDPVQVLCGFDSRASSEYLAEAARHGVESSHCKFVSHGLLTTPQLHYIVRCFNDPAYGTATEDGYYRKYSDAFNAMLEVIDSTKVCPKQLVVDCANGVGAVKLKKLLSCLKSGCIDATCRNVDGTLNYQCGADFVKIEQKFPNGFDSVPKTVRCASLDGDADRLLYFCRDQNDQFVLLDGDKIATLFAKFFQEQLKGAELTDAFSLAVVQTAYANGSSTRYIKEHLGLEPHLVPTGVKHLHHEALKYDIGIYFEANGHGTVLFSDKFKQVINRVEVDEKIEVKRLRLFSTLINEVVGDAMSDLLAVEMLLMHYGWTVEDWASNLYTDAPSCQLKVKVKDRTIFKTIFDETRLTAPSSLQTEIDMAVAQIQLSRCFVRPSGTEDIVRVYAEAPTPEQARSLAQTVKGLVEKVFDV